MSKEFFRVTRGQTMYPFSKAESGGAMPVRVLVELILRVYG